MRAARHAGLAPRLRLGALSTSPLAPRFPTRTTPPLSLDATQGRFAAYPFPKVDGARRSRLLRHKAGFAELPQHKRENVGVLFLFSGRDANHPVTL